MKQREGGIDRGMEKVMERVFSVVQGIGAERWRDMAADGG